MKKWIIRSIIAFVLIIVLVVVGAFVFIDSIVKTGVETVGPKVTKVEIKLKSAKISAFSGSGELSGLFVGNPEGYKTPSAITVEDVKVAVKPSSLLSDVIQVDEVRIQAPEITLEQALSGSNLNKILENINQAVESETPSKEKKTEEKEKPAKKIYIRNVSIEGGKIHLSLKLAGGKSLTVPLPPLHLAELGSPEKGITPAEATQQVMKALMSETVKATAGAIGSVGKEALDLGKDAKEKTGKAVDKIKNIFK